MKNKPHGNSVKRGPNKNHYLYKGDNISYITLHGWVHGHKLDPGLCEHCGVKKVKLQWANKSHEYKRDLDDWVRLCIPCHRKHDLDENGNKRTDTTKFGISGKDRKNGKLTNEQIVEIFLSTLSQPVLAKKYGVRQNYISRIQTRKRAARITRNLEIPLRKPHNHKLTPELVLKIYNAKGEQSEISKKYAISKMAVSNIKTGYTWGSITGKVYSKRYSKK